MLGINCIKRIFGYLYFSFKCIYSTLYSNDTYFPHHKLFIASHHVLGALCVMLVCGR